MSANKVLQDIFLASPMLDPGASQTIAADRSPAFVPLVSAAAETRTLAAPTRAGLIITLGVRTYVGAITVTVTGGYDAAGSTVFTFSATKQFAVFVSVESPAGTFVWRLAASHATASPGTLIRAEINTAITTIGAGTLTAAAIVGGDITRSGSVAAYTDTTDTAALVIAALPVGTPVGASWEMTIKNTVAFAETLAGGSGVTLSGQTIIPPNSAGRFLVTYATATTVTIVGLEVGPLTTGPLLASTNLSTVGAGTITAAGIVGGVTNRTGSTAAFTDTTDTGTAINSALPNANVGQSWYWTYYNNTKADATLAAAAGVTLSGTGAIVQAQQWAEYLVTLTAANTVTIQGIAMGPIVDLMPAKFNTRAMSTSTAAAGELTGANFVVMANSGATPGNYTTRTGAQMVADIPNAQVGFSYMLRLWNNQGTGSITLVAGDGNVTLTGTMTVGINTFRDFVVTITASNTLTIQSTGVSGTGP